MTEEALVIEYNSILILSVGTKYETLFALYLE